MNSIVSMFVVFENLMCIMLKKHKAIDLYEDIFEWCECEEKSIEIHTHLEFVLSEICDILLQNEVVKLEVPSPPLYKKLTFAPLFHAAQYL